MSILLFQTPATSHSSVRGPSAIPVLVSPIDMIESRFYLTETPLWLAGMQMTQVLRARFQGRQIERLWQKTWIHHEDTTTECTLLRNIGE